jgi:hypothetical protein
VALQLVQEKLDALKLIMWNLWFYWVLVISDWVKAKLVALL